MKNSLKTIAIACALVVSQQTMPAAYFQQAGSKLSSFWNTYAPAMPDFSGVTKKAGEYMPDMSAAKTKGTELFKAAKEATRPYAKMAADKAQAGFVAAQGKWNLINRQRNVANIAISAALVASFVSVCTAVALRCAHPYLKARREAKAVQEAQRRALEKLAQQMKGRALYRIDGRQFTEAESAEIARQIEAEVQSEGPAYLIRREAESQAVRAHHQAFLAMSRQQVEAQHARDRQAEENRKTTARLIAIEAMAYSKKLVVEGWNQVYTVEPIENSPAFKLRSTTTDEIRRVSSLQALLAFYAPVNA